MKAFSVYLLNGWMDGWMDGLVGEGVRSTFVASSVFWVEGSPRKFSVKLWVAGQETQSR